MMKITCKYPLSFFLIAAVCCFAPTKTYSQDKDLPKELYTANGIPDSLKEDANSIVRYSSDELTVEGSGKAIIKHHSLMNRKIF